MTNRSTSACLICKHPETLPERGLVHDACRNPLAGILTDIADLYATITGTTDLVPDESRKPAPGPNGTTALTTIPAVKDGPIGLKILHRDAIAQLLPAGPVPGNAGQPRVSGSREAALPVPVDRIDVAMPGRQGSVAATWSLVPATRVEDVVVNYRSVRFDEVKQPDGTRQTVPTYVLDEIHTKQRRLVLDAAGKTVMVDGRDQVGHISTASILDSWVRSWRDARNKQNATAAQLRGEEPIQGEGLPAQYVVQLCHWLSVRIDWACESYPEIGEFAREMRFLRVVLRSIAEEPPPKPEHLPTPCKRCDLVTMWRDSEEAYPVSCHACGLIFTEAEYETWTKILVASVKKGKAA